MALAIYLDMASARKTDLQLNLLAVGVGADAAVGRDGLIPHREPTKFCVGRHQRRIGVSVGWLGLPIGGAFPRLNHDSVVSAAFEVAHCAWSFRCYRIVNQAQRIRPILI